MSRKRPESLLDSVPFDVLNELKALSCLVPKSEKEMEHVNLAIDRILRKYPELRKPFHDYMHEGCNFLFCPNCGVVIPLGDGEA